MNEYDEECLLTFLKKQSQLFADQIYDTQSLDAVELSDDAPYTSQIILNAIRQAVEKAAVNKTAASCISLIVFYPSTIR